MVAPAQPQRFRSRFDRRSFGAVVMAGVICLVLVTVAFLAARNSPSSTTGLTSGLPLPDVDADQGCENFGRYWTETSEAKIDPAALERFSNCLLEDDGTWVAAETMYGAAPLDASTLTEEQRTQLEATRAAIEQQIDGLEATLPRSVENAFDQLHTSDTNAVVGHFQEGVSWGTYRTRYARIVNAYMLDPQNADLASYIGWIMNRKIDGYAQFRQQCLGNDTVAMLHTACRGMEDNLSIRYAPLPWDLRDPDLLDTWFYETVVKPPQTEQDE
jgi:hypothetical protein